jgi:DNA-binding response OmpR family regulator
VVDDDAAYYEVWNNSIPKAHALRVEFKHVTDLEQAFRELYRKDDYYQVILLDLGLPPYWGIDTYRVFRARIPEVPIIVLTGTEDTELDAALRNEGASRVLWKDGVTPTGIVKAVFDVRLEQQQRSSLENALQRATKSAEKASLEYRDAVRNSEAPLTKELHIADAHVSTAEALNMLTRLFLTGMHENAGMKVQLQQIAAQMQAHADHPARLAVVEERTRHQHDSLVDFRDDMKDHRRAPAEWISHHRAAVIGTVGTVIIAIATAIIAALAGQKVPPPPTINAPPPAATQQQ